MTLSTSGEDGSVKSRVVLLKAVDTGFCFFTNYDSSKGEQLSRNPKAAIHFFWPCFERQVRIEGIVSKTSEEFSDQYFQARPRSSQLGAIASPQSRVIDATYDLQHKVDELEKAYDGKIIPRPGNWGGYRLSPTMIEFWQGRPSRLHDRFRYLRESTTSPWAIDRLAP
jgi:pyridoxamine 5'-phosphate oxidase